MSDNGSGVPTGVSGLDEILHGGLVEGRGYLVTGGPGTGKTTLGLQFLSHGTSRGERALCITLSQPADQMISDAERSGLDMGSIEFLDLSPSSEFFAEGGTYDVFSPAEVEREPVELAIREKVEELKPERIVVDSMTQFRYLSPDDYQFRKQVLSFLRYLIENQATVLFVSEAGDRTSDEDLQFLADGVIHLSNRSQVGYLEISKLRGSGFIAGPHAYRLDQGGMRVFPRIRPEVLVEAVEHAAIGFGVPALDQLLGGGIERGTVTLLTGPSGVGKTTLALQFMKEAAGRGERSAGYMFEERIETLRRRAEGVNIQVGAMLKGESLSLVQIEPLDMSPDEFAALVRRDVEERGARVVLIDSISGYGVSLRDEDLVRRLHSLCNWLRNRGVTVLLINEVEWITGDFRATDSSVSYLADNIIFLRYFEERGALHKAIGVLKKRLSGFEKLLRKLEITEYGIKVGDPLTGMQGVLSGSPEMLRSRTNGAAARGEIGAADHSADRMTYE